MHLGGGADCADGEEDAGPRRQSNSGTSDVFSKINSRLGNFDGVSEKEGGGVGVEDRRVLPRAPAFLTRVHFLPSSSLPSYQLILPVPVLDHTILTHFCHPQLQHSHRHRAAPSAYNDSYYGKANHYAS